MKRIFLASIFIILFYITQAQESSFSFMEINHVRVTTPELFNNSNQIKIYLDSISETEYSFPLPNGKVISEYGQRGSRQHTGIDIKTCSKDTIRSAFGGVVRMSKLYSSYGNVIVVRHSFGIETVYSHNFTNLVKSGDVVKAGQAIALTGATGRATTEHLHFETRIGGKHFDPNLIFDMKTQTLQNRCLQCIKNKDEILIQPDK